jgi:hypothetical protein
VPLPGAVLRALAPLADELGLGPSRADSVSLKILSAELVRPENLASVQRFENEMFVALHIDDLNCAQARTLAPLQNVAGCIGFRWTPAQHFMLAAMPLFASLSRWASGLFPEGMVDDAGIVEAHEQPECGSARFRGELE